MDIRIKTDITEEILSVEEGETNLAFPFIKYEDSDTDEIALINSMITAVRTLLERRTGLSFAERTYEIFFKSEDSPFVIPIIPIISVDKVEKVDYLGEKEELTLNASYFKRGLYEVEVIVSGKYDLLVTCKAGYGTTTETLPGDLTEAIKRQVAQWYENRDDYYDQKLLGSVDKIVSLYRKVLI